MSDFIWQGKGHERSLSFRSVSLFLNVEKANPGLESARVRPTSRPRSSACPEGSVAIGAIRRKRIRAALARRLGHRPTPIDGDLSAGELGRVDGPLHLGPAVRS